MPTLKINRQALEDLCRHFLPLMVQFCEAQVRTYKGTEFEMLHRMSRSLMNDISKQLWRKQLTESKKINLKFSEAEAIILMHKLIEFPIPGEIIWRNNLRNHLVGELHKQLSENIINHKNYSHDMLQM